MTTGAEKSREKTAWERANEAWYDAQTTDRLHTLYAGAWDACDVDGARNAIAALRRRGEDVSRYRWGAD